MTSGQQVAVPAPGQLVAVRNRQWVAADVVRGGVASSGPNVLTGQAPHLVRLASIEDDARDDELSVVWELEPGTVVHDVAVLPSPEHGFDEPSEFAAFLHAVRWGAIASADTTALQAVALPPGAALGDTVESQPARATQRPGRPARPARARGAGAASRPGWLTVSVRLVQHRVAGG